MRVDSEQSVDLASYSSRFSFSHKLQRGVWCVVWWLLFRFSPRPLFAWRAALLRLFGARLGRGVHVYPSAKIWLPAHLEMGDHSCLGFGVDCYNVGRVSLASHVTVSQYAMLCAASHDIADPSLGLIHSPINVQSSAWICAGAFVGMGTTIAEGAVVGARAVVTKDVAAWTVVAGNPARVIGTRRLRT